GAFALYGVFPHVGTALGGNTVTLTGQGLATGGLSVTFGGQAATIVSASFSTATVTVPARGNKTRKVDVAASAGASNGTLTAGYTYRLELASITPAAGPAAGGTSPTVAGSGLPADAELL